MSNLTKEQIDNLKKNIFKILTPENTSGYLEVYNDYLYCIGDKIFKGSKEMEYLYASKRLCLHILRIDNKIVVHANDKKLFIPSVDGLNPLNISYTKYGFNDLVIHNKLVVEYEDNNYGIFDIEQNKITEFYTDVEELCERLNSCSPRIHKIQADNDDSFFIIEVINLHYTDSFKFLGMEHKGMFKTYEEYVNHTYEEPYEALYEALSYGYLYPEYVDLYKEMNLKENLYYQCKDTFLLSELQHKEDINIFFTAEPV
jgi:hypothetical protein